MEYFVPSSEDESNSKPFTAPMNMKEDSECETKNSIESEAYNVNDVHVKVEPLEPELLSHFVVDVEVTNLTEGTIKKELDLFDEACNNATDTYIVTNDGSHMEVCITKETCSSPIMDKFVVDTVDDTHKCGNCQKKFDNNSSLTMHMFIHDKDKSALKMKINKNNVSQEAETIACKICGLQFRSLTIYLKHRQTHLFDKPFKCEICEKDFNTKFLLSNHERIHTGEKPFTCDLCDKTFTEKVNLNRHKRSHLGTKPYRCDVCSNSFSLKHNLATHIMFSHTSEKLWPYKCEFCKKRWCIKKDLTRHLRTHTGERPFSCQICKKSFPRKEYLACHIQCHNNKRPFGCEICNKQFVCKSECKKHLKIHKNEQNN